MVYEQPADSPPLRDDLFPARVFSFPRRVTGAGAPKPDPTSASWVPDGAELLLQPARVLLSATHLWIFQDSPDGPALHTHAALDDLEGDRRQGFRVTITPSATNPHPEYTDLVITRYAHCGCGSRLRSFRPFRSMRLIA